MITLDLNDHIHQVVQLDEDLHEFHSFRQTVRVFVREDLAEYHLLVASSGKQDTSYR